MLSEYHGIVIKEGLRDQTALKNMRILGQKKSPDWTLLKVGVDCSEIEDVVRLVQANLITVDTVPFYAHFYRGEELIVIFPERIFHITPDRGTWDPVVNYGNSKGIPAKEMDIRPCRFEEENY